MPILRRESTDPLWTRLTNAYFLNLLAIPREMLEIGDVFEECKKRIQCAGSLDHFLEPPMKIPKTEMRADETMADVAGLMSGATSLKAGLGLLEGFMMAIGAGGLLGNVRAAYERGGTSALRFKFDSPTRDSVDVSYLGSQLIRHQIPPTNALIQKGCRYYVVTAVVRSSSISVVAERGDSSSVDVDVSAAIAAQGSLGLSVAKSAQGALVYSGGKKLAFGMELRELKYDRGSGSLKLLMPDHEVKTLGIEGPTSQPALLGGPDGRLFLEIGDR